MNLNTMIYPSASAESTIRMLITPGHSFPGTKRNGIILHGPFGTGKSSCAKLLPADIEAKYSTQKPNVRHENCMAGNNGVGLIESIDKQSKGYPLSGSFHYVILDEADNLTADAMKQLKCVMNSVDANGLFTTAFIMTTNHLNRIDAGVRSRSHCIPFAPESTDVWIPLVRNLLDEHGVPNVSRITDSYIRTNVIAKGNDPRSILANSEIVAIQLKAAIVQRQAQVQAPAPRTP
ncbi:AAA family ATPase [Paraburkholderia dipogonis]|uniref:AAA family ATPase n=1 Tax=Paraburkholderia dipogonis TaxID=1211383 RepID=UPI0038BC67D1